MTSQQQLNANELLQWSIDRTRQAVNFTNYTINYNNNNNNNNNDTDNINTSNMFSTWNAGTYQDALTMTRVGANLHRQGYYYNTFNEIDNAPRRHETWQEIIPFNYITPESPPRRRLDNINLSVEYFSLTEEERNCCVCYETKDSEEFCKLNCGHSFCVTCIDHHLERNRLCPLCRASIGSIRVQNNNALDRINRE